jgi:hypothetical protein
VILYVGRHGVSPRLATRSGPGTILCIGDQVTNGFYARHSTFRRAVNFSDHQRVITIVPDTMEPGPTQIVLRDFDPDALGATIRIDDHVLQIGSVPYAIQSVPIFDSRLDIEPKAYPGFRGSLDALRGLLLDRASPQSLVFLLDSNRPRPSAQSFERMLAERMTAGTRLLWECLPHGRPHLQLREAIGLMAGAGVGLTPAGDDFIAGTLLGLYMHGRMTGRDHAFVRQVIFDASHSRNLLSMHFLNLAHRGFFNAALKDLAQALCGDEADAIESSAGRVLAMGATSGADLAIGFITTLETCMGDYR